MRITDTAIRRAVSKGIKDATPHGFWDAFNEGDHPREGGKFTAKGGAGKGEGGHTVKWEKGTTRVGGKVSGSGGHKRGTLNIAGKEFSVTKHPWGQVSLNGVAPHGVRASEVGPHPDVDTLAHHIKKHLDK